MDHREGGKGASNENQVRPYKRRVARDWTQKKDRKGTEALKGGGEKLRKKKKI